MTSKPTIACIPGSWHTPEIYEATFQTLQKRGYETVGISLPSNGATPAHESFQGDVQGIRDALVKLIETEGKDVILTCHSYSGIPMTEAAASLGKPERQSKGLPGGIVRICYIMSFAVPEGFELVGEYPEWMKWDKKKGIVTVTPEDAKAIFYNDLPQPVADEWISKLVHESEGVYHGTTTHAAWRHMPSTYVRGARDASTFTPELVDWMIEACRKEKPGAFDVVEVCPEGGHCLMISHPEWLAGVLRRAAGEAV